MAENFSTSFSLPEQVPVEEVPALLKVDLCAEDRPLALLPVRLETRFFGQTDGSYELRVRVYPDKIHINSHEAALTSAEVEWGKHYWEQRWRAGGNREQQELAWRQLVDRFDAARAGWVARVLTPTNPTDAPSAPVALGSTLSKEPKFLEVAVHPEQSKDTSWQRAPIARLLPDRWTALAYSAGKVVVSAQGKSAKSEHRWAGPARVRVRCER